MSVFRNLLMKITGWLGKPADWSDIRKDCPANSIALYAGHTADYSQYDNLGFTATCTGGYNVFIDGVQYGSTYASGAQCSITWSTSGITTGDDITTPSALKAHKIWIVPATEGNNITAFKHQRVGEGSDYEQQGALWVHFNITNAINLDSMCSPYPYTFAPSRLTAVTAKNNIIDCGNSFTGASFNISALTYVPTIKNGSITSIAFNSSSIEKVELDTCTFGDNSNYCFNACHNLKDVKLKNPTFLQNGKFVYTFYETMLKTFPANWDWTNVVEAQDIWTDYDRTNNNGTPTVIDARAATGLKILGIHDTNTLVGLRVSSSAPFNSGTSPQIDVHNTALDRTALVQLFNDLPTVSDGQIINITGCTGALDLDADDLTIAENKGWTVVGGPELTTYYAYTNENNNNYYTVDNPIQKSGTFVFNSQTTNNGCYNIDNGQYQGGEGKYITYNADNSITLEYQWRIRAHILYQGGSTYPSITGGNNGQGYFTFPCLSFNENTVRVTMSSDGTTPDLDYGNIGAHVSYNNWYYIEMGGVKTTNGYKYYLEINQTGYNDNAVDNPTWSASSNLKAYYSGQGIMLMNVANSNEHYNNSVLDLINTSFEYKKTSVNDAFTKITFGDISSNTSTLYENASSIGFTPEVVDPQPIFTTEYSGLKNLENRGCANLGNGQIKGGAEKIIQTNFVPDFANATTWSIKTKYTAGTGDHNNSTVFCYGYTSGSSYTDCSAPFIDINGSSNFRLAMSSNGSSWNMIAGYDTGISISGTTWLDLHYTGTQYILSYKKKENDNYTDIILPIDNPETTKAVCTSPVGFLNLPYSLSSYYATGTIDMSATSITVNNNTTYMYYNYGGIIISNILYKRNSDNDKLAL